MPNKIDCLIAYCRQDGRICPNPGTWSTLWSLLPAADGEPPAPLILAAWNAPALFKMLRLEEQIRWADKHDAFEVVASFLHRLPENNWYHFGE
jgi:hypothetical protein